MTKGTEARRPTSDDDRAVDTWLQMVKCITMINSQVMAAVRAAFNLGEADVATLVMLSRLPAPRAALSTLAAEVGFTSGGYTKIADRLVSRELARRVPCETDRRVTYLELTDSGVELASDLRCLLADVVRARVIDVLGEERAALILDDMLALFEANAGVSSVDTTI